MVRLKDIALRAGVSVMTVSKALRDEPDVAVATKSRIQALAQEMGYVPDSSAQGLRTRTTKLFGVILPSMVNPIFSRILLAIQERSFELGYDLLLSYTFNNAEREDSCIRRCLSRRVDGLFVSPVYRMEPEARIYQELLQRQVPTIVLGHLAPFCSRFLNVETDDLSAGFQVTQHFLGMGHRRIAFLAGPPASPWSQERFEGYRRALRAVGMEVDDKLIFQAGRTLEDGENAGLEMIHENSDATAVQAINDLVAVGCANLFLKRGLRIPGDISIAGFGNTLVSEYFRVPLSSVSQPKYRLGSAAVDLMQQMLRGVRPEPKRLPAQLVVRESSGTASATPALRRVTTPNT